MGVPSSSGRVSSCSAVLDGVKCGILDSGSFKKIWKIIVMTLYQNTLDYIEYIKVY